MIPKEIKYNLHCDDVREDFLWPIHGITQMMSTPGAFIILSIMYIFS